MSLNIAKSVRLSILHFRVKGFSRGSPLFYFLGVVAVMLLALAILHSLMNPIAAMTIPGIPKITHEANQNSPK